MPERKPLTAELIRSLMEYNPDTGLLTWKPRPLEMFPAATPSSQYALWAAWNAKNAGREACACVDGGYKSGGLFYNKLRAHRAAWAIMTGKMPAEHIDHINGDGTDNRWCNLRLATYAENAKNQKLHRTNTSGHTGVSWAADKQKWIAYFWDGRTSRKLGSFDDVEEAAKVARQAREDRGYHTNHGSAR
jgi:hypothetical protein